METSVIKNVIQKFFVFPFLIVGLISSYSQTAKEDVSKQKKHPDSPELILSAAASMQDVLQEIKQLYLTKYPDAKITFNFGSSGSLQHQIEQGAPIDIFISAAPQQMNDLSAKKLLLNETRQDLVKNQMVLITSLENNLVASFNDLSKQSIEHIALGEPNSVPAGEYAQEILTSFNLFDELQSKAVYGKDVRQVLNYVATGNIEVGMVYHTDINDENQVKVVATAPETTHSPIIYPVAALKDSSHPQAAKQMIEFLFTVEAQAIFRKYGFMAINS